MSASPIEMAYRAALLRRAQALPEAARQALQARLDAAGARLPAAVVPAAPDVAKPGAGASPRPDLAALVQALQRQAGGEPTLLAGPADTHNPAEPGAPPDPAGAAQLSAPGSGAPAPAAATAAVPELKSVRQFRGAWKRLNAEHKLRQSRAQVPENAGPLNAQRLVHRALALMQATSPAYLQQFVQQVETLLALEAWAAAQGEASAKPAPPRRKPRAGPDTAA